MAMTVKEMEPALATRRAFPAFDLVGRFKDMTSLTEAESKYGHVVQSAGDRFCRQARGEAEDRNSRLVC
jgi:hypothetical protein